MSDLRVLVEGMSFTECPRWHDGHLYFSDFYTEAVYRTTVDGNGSASTVCTVPGRPAGLGWLPDQSMLVVSQQSHSVLRLVGGELIQHADMSGLVAGDANDMIVLDDGTAYVGSIGFDVADLDGFAPAALVRVAPDGMASIASEPLAFPNGTVQTSDGRLVVAESFANRLSSFAIAADGSLVDRRTWAAFGPAQTSTNLMEIIGSAVVGPDGTCVDAEDAIWIADCFHNRVLRVIEGGKIETEIPIPDTQAFAVALGGPDGRHLFICTAPSAFEHECVAKRDSKILVTEVAVPAA